MSHEEKNQGIPTVPVKIMRDEVPYLYNVLCDNAHPWNKRLRTELANFTTETENFNAKMRLLGRQP